MVILLEALGVLVLICGALVFFVIRGRHRKIMVIACTLLLLLGCVGAIAFERGDLPFPNRAAPIAATISLLFSGANGNSGQMTLESLNARDGTVRWHYMIPFKAHTSPLAPMVSGTSVYVVGTDRAYQALVLYALDARHGILRWSRVLGTYGQDWIWEGAGPLSLDGEVYIAVGHGPPGQALVSAFTTLYAFGGNDGRTLWSKQLPNVAYQPGVDWGADPAVLAADAGLLFVNEQDGHVHALRANDGSLAWVVPAGVGTLGTEGGILYQAGPIGRSLMALCESDGVLLWSDDFDSLHSIALDGEHLVAFTSSASGARSTLTSIEPESGHVLWSYPVGGGSSVPLAVHGVVYFADGFTLDAVHLSDGHLLWQESVPDHTYSQFEVVAAPPQADVLYVATSPYVGEDPFFDPATCGCLPAPEVYALNTGDGAAYWQYRPPVTWDSGLFLQAGRSE